jgi:diacylglycerol kinase family enzyme
MRTYLQGRDSILVIVGPRCGTAVTPATLRELLGPDVRACWATRSGEATELADRFGVEHSTICVFGGDGTVSEVVNGLWQIAAGSAPALAIFPAGTSNVLARHFGCPTFRAAVCAATDGEGIPLNVAELVSDDGRTRLAALSLSTGAMAAACLLANSLRWLGQKRIEVGQLFSRLTNGEYRVSVEGDQKTVVHGWHYSISHVGQRAFGTNLLPVHLPSDRPFVVTQTLLRRSATGLLRPDPVCHRGLPSDQRATDGEGFGDRFYDVARGLRLEHEDDSPVCVDGDLWTCGCFQARARTSPVRVLVPREVCLLQGGEE